VVLNSLALTNTSGATESYSVDNVNPSGDVSIGSGTLPAGATQSFSGTPLWGAAYDPFIVHASGTMAVSEDLGPSGGTGVVTMPGIPLAAAIGL
jgi:hypothetical protein